LFGGIAVIGSRPIGFVVYGIIVVIAALANGRPWAMLKNHHRSFAAHTVAIFAMIVWYFVVYDAQSSSSLVAGTDGMSLSRQITHGIESIPRMIDESFGNFGWLDTPMPRLALYLLVGLVAAGMSMGLRGANSRTLGAIALALVTVGAMVVVIDVNYYGLFRVFGVQGRHVAPIMVGAILIATSRLSSHTPRDRVFAVSWALLVGWSSWGALRRYTVGIRPDNVFDMFSTPQWTPMLGLWPSLVLLMTAPLVVAFVVTMKRGGVS
jgi:lipoprotein signal peptidase